MTSSSLKDTLQLIQLSRFSIREMELFDMEGNLLNKIIRKNQINDIIRDMSIPIEFLPFKGNKQYIIRFHTSGNSMRSVYTCLLGGIED